MPPNPTMTADMAEGALRLSFRSDGTLHVDLNHLEASKSWTGPPTCALKSQLTAPGTQSYAKKHVANRTPSAATLATNHGHSPSDDLPVTEFLRMIKLEITQVIQDSLAEIRLQSTQQHTALMTNTTATTMTTMKTTPPTTLPTPLTMRSIDQSIKAHTDRIPRITDRAEDTKLWLQLMEQPQATYDRNNPHLPTTATRLIVLTATAPPLAIAPHATPTAHPCPQPTPAPVFPKHVWTPSVPPAPDPTYSNNPQPSDTASNTTNPNQQPAAPIKSLPPPSPVFPFNPFHRKNILANMRHQPHPSPSFLTMLSGMASNKYRPP